MHKKRISNFILLISLCVFFAFAPCHYASANEPEDQTTYVVLDISGSMKTVDPQNQVATFSSLLLDLYLNTDNKIGFIAFNEDLAWLIEPTEVNDYNIDSLHRSISTYSYSKNTDLGLGLSEVLKKIQANKNESARILLFSDGEITLLRSMLGRQDSENQADQKRSVNALSELGVSIHAITLNSGVESDLAATRQLAEKTGGEQYLLDPRSPLLPQLLSAYAKASDLSLSKISDIKIEKQSQPIDVRIPYADYVLSLNYVLFPSKPLTDCIYNDAAAARIYNGDRYSVVSSASPTVLEQSLILSAPIGTQVDIYTLKNISMQMQLNYDKDSNLFLAEITNPLTGKVISGMNGVNVTVRISQADQLIDSISLTRNGSVYTSSYSIPEGDVIQATAETQLNNDIIYSNTVALPARIPGPVALTADLLSLEQKNKLTIDLSSYFYYDDPASLSYSVSNSDVSAENITVNGHHLEISKPERISNGYIDIVASDPYSSEASIRVPIKITMSMVFRILAIVVGALVFIALILLLFSYLRSKQTHFSGIIYGRFIHTRSGRDIPELFWLNNVLAQYHKLSLAQLFSILHVEEDHPEAKHILFAAKENGVIQLVHQTNCNVLLESRTIHRGQKFLLHYGDHVTIFFEDATAELELEYMEKHPALDKDGRRRLVVQMTRS